ncbi:ABC-three component system middle component 1 [Pseudomonas viridiflava]|uniref:ABC-three component system middle component 1 n=1 Tax=Pseudomonas viridiflava TaxID=33069 RepID=UPI0013CE7BED|nr:ABC-three component system middle component 1 [Pseudomonas viridiflava]
MSCDDLRATVLELAESRFLLTELERSDYLYSLVQDDIFTRSVVTLKKRTAKSGGNKTLLLACFSSPDQIELGAKWAADVRDALPEPEASDLYLFLSVEGLSEGECSRLEADEQFCRKYVLRPNETNSSLVLRTFLGPLVVVDEGGNVADPIVSAMRSTEKEHEWLDAPMQEYWKELFLSSRESAVIASLLIGEGTQEE